jgi:hypothetical protein
VRGLGSESEVERVASAALTRRFFDRESEFGAGGLPYAGDALRVVAAVLRSEPAGTTQKLLADGLRWAPSLAYSDFQRANLRDCYWGAGRTETPVDAHGADFFRADLSTGSLRRAILRKAVFRDAQLLRTVLDEADCKDADFRGADLRGASFKGSLLLGAMFDSARHIPAVISAGLDSNRRYCTADPLPATTAVEDIEEHRVFISAPSHMDRADELVLEQVLIGLTNAGFEIVRVLPPAYGKNAPLSEIAHKIRSCEAVVVYGPPQFRVQRETGGSVKASHILDMSTPWNHVEAGIAVGLDKPLLVLRQGANGGVFDVPDHPGTVTRLNIADPEALVKLTECICAWAKECAP